MVILIICSVFVVEDYLFSVQPW